MELYILSGNYEIFLKYSLSQLIIIYQLLFSFLATLVALHFTPVSKWLIKWVVVSD